LENLLDLMGSQTRNAISRFLALQGKTCPYGDGGCGRSGWLRHRYPTTGRPCHLGESCSRPFEMMKPIVDENEVEDIVGKRESLDIRNDRRDVEPIPACAFAGPLRGAKREVARDNSRSGSGEELGIHPRPPADDQGGGTKEAWSDRPRRSAELLMEQETIEAGRAVWPGDLELLRDATVEVLCLCRLVRMYAGFMRLSAVQVVDLVMF
jgi:hypothetical protein